MRALLWNLFFRSALPQPATVVVDTTGEGAALASVLLVRVAKLVTVVAGTTG